MPNTIVVAEPIREVFEKLTTIVPSGRLVQADRKVAAQQRIVFGALRPPVMGTVLDDIAPDLRADAALMAMLNGATETIFAGGMTHPEVLDPVPVRPLREDEQTVRDVLTRRLDAQVKRLRA